MKNKHEQAAADDFPTCAEMLFSTFGQDMQETLVSKTAPRPGLLLGGLFIFGIFLLQVLNYFWVPGSMLSCFSAFLFCAFPACLLLCFTCFFSFLLSLLFCFCALPASFLFCFSALPAWLLFCFCAFRLLLSYFFFSSVMCFAALLPGLCFSASCLYCLSLFFSFLLLYSPLFINTLGETQRNPT